MPIMVKIDFGLGKKEFIGAGLRGSLEDFSSDGLHTHPFHQVLRIKNGVALLQDDQLTKPQFGHLTAFIPAHSPHRTKVLGQAVEYQSLYFSRSLLPKYKDAITLFRMSDLGIALLDNLNTSASLRNLNKGLARECLMLFIKVLVRDLRTEVSLPALRSPAHAMNKRVCAFLEQNYHRKITAEDLALLPLSFRQLSRNFKTEMRICMFDYLRLFRMLQAAIRLKTTDDKISTVAVECGYNSISSFFTDFKKTYSVSPRGFRKSQ
jgi:AraC-like DNA-binding protein